MSRKVITIMKKEFARFFGDRRLIITTFVLPALMIYIMYSFMGDGMEKQFTTAEDYIYGVYAVNLPASFSSLKTMQDVDIIEVDLEEAESVKGLLAEQETDLLLVFPENFDDNVAAYDSAGTETAAPEVKLYYNSVSTESSSVYNMVYGMLDTYEATLTNKFDVNIGNDAEYDMATEEETAAKFFSMMLPMLLIMFLFSGCMAIAPESIAGEKERGTIATLLVTPMKRSELAIGKILSLSVISLLGGLSSFVGMMISLPKLMGGMNDIGEMGVAVYSVKDYVLLLLTILSTVLLIVAVISIISGMTKSVKEASTAVTPLMVVVMVVGVTSMFGDGASREWYWYLIPFYNSVQCMNGIFSFQMELMNLVVALISNLVYTLIMAGVLAKIFDSERMMYI